MEIILNKNLCTSLHGRLRPHCPWVLRMRNGKVHALYRGDRNTDIKHAWFRVFYHDLRTLQAAKYIDRIELTEQERRIVEL